MELNFPHISAHNGNGQWPKWWVGGAADREGTTRGSGGRFSSCCLFGPLCFPSFYLSVCPTGLHKMKRNPFKRFCMPESINELPLSAPNELPGCFKTLEMKGGLPSYFLPWHASGLLSSQQNKGLSSQKRGDSPLGRTVICREETLVWGQVLWSLP